MALRSIYGMRGFASDEDLDAALADRRIKTVTLTWSDPELREVMTGRTLAIRRGQGRDWERWLKAHSLGHACLHVGKQAEIPEALVAWQETQAEEFAGWFIIGEPSAHYGGFPLTLRYVAATGAMPLECVEKWWRMVGGGLVGTVPYRLARSAHWSRVQA